MTEKITFIGGGNMAAALVGGLVASGVSPLDIGVVDLNPDQLNRLADSYGVRTFTTAQPAVQNATVVVWAVKPQVLREAAESISQIMSNVLHVSIAAGIRLQDLTRWLESDRVVRAMPNTAALVGAGVTGLLAGTAVSAADRHLTEQLLSATGGTFWVDSDEDMNAVTAVSGSGPAYVFHFLEGFQVAAEQVGFSSERARDLALQVVSGAVKQALQGGESFGELRQRVTSKRGTTEAALAVLERFSTQRAMIEAIQAACDRGRDLGTELGADAVRSSL